MLELRRQAGPPRGVLRGSACRLGTGGLIFRNPAISVAVGEVGGNLACPLA